MFWIILAGVAFFFGVLTFLILQREKELILSHYKEKSSEVVELAAQNLITMMTNENPDVIAQNVRAFNKTKETKIGIIGKNGLPAFGTDIAVQKQIFDAQEDHILTEGNEYVFFKPLSNDVKCHGCHSAEDNTRGMIIIKTSMKTAHEEITNTAKRLLLFALLLGFTSELFLMFILKKNNSHPS